MEFNNCSVNDSFTAKLFSCILHTNAALINKIQNCFILLIIKSDKQTFKCISACVNYGTAIHTTKRAACEQLPGSVRP